MDQSLVVIIGLFILAVVSGMLGFGVAFAAVPFLGLFFTDLVHQVQPLSLLLNGVTAAFSAWGFARSHLVAWRQALSLAAVTTLAAPLGAAAAQRLPQGIIWSVYFIAVVYLAYRLFKPARQGCGRPRFALVLVLAVPIAVLSGLLGVGPGFLLMPTMILLCYEPKQAAAINAVAVTPPSFSALLPHLATAQFDGALTAALVAVGAIGSFLGARITSRWLPGARIKQLFGILIVLMTTYKLVQVVWK
jgi:hypothetical protein